MDEGYIKFHLDHDKSAPPESSTLTNLLKARDALHQLRLIGVMEDGIGFGNISIRKNGTNQFIITASATGSIYPITKQQVSLVTSFDIKTNSLSCRGLLPASSESLSHGAVYLANPLISAVAHVHSALLYESLPIEGWPVTTKSAAFGTPAIAIAISEAVQNSGQNSGLIVMGGHEDGILSFGPDLDSTCKLLIDRLK